MNIKKKIFPEKKESSEAVRLLLINISTHFTSDKDIGEYDVLEPPLGLISLLSYVNRTFGEKIKGIPKISPAADPTF